MTRVSLSVLFTFLMLFSKAQGVASEPQMADRLRADGKIYIVITVIAIIFAAIIVFLTALDRKIKKLEDQLNEGRDPKNKN